MLSSLVRNVSLARSAKTVVNRRFAPTATACFFSSDSHDDFAPQRKAVDGEDEALKLIKVSLVRKEGRNTVSVHMSVVMHRSFLTLYAITVIMNPTGIHPQGLRLSFIFTKY